MGCFLKYNVGTIPWHAKLTYKRVQRTLNACNLYFMLPVLHACTCTYYRQSTHLSNTANTSASTACSSTAPSKARALSTSSRVVFPSYDAPGAKQCRISISTATIRVCCCTACKSRNCRVVMGQPAGSARMAVMMASTLSSCQQVPIQGQCPPEPSSSHAIAHDSRCC